MGAIGQTCMYNAGPSIALLQLRPYGHIAEHSPVKKMLNLALSQHVVETKMG